MPKMVFKCLFCLFVWGSSLYGYIVAYKKICITLPIESRRSADDDGRRTIYFFYDVHNERFFQNRRAK